MACHLLVGMNRLQGALGASVWVGCFLLFDFCMEENSKLTGAGCYFYNKQGSSIKHAVYTVCMTCRPTTQHFYIYVCSI